jgi:CRP-like cAMP-binding protein
MNDLIKGFKNISECSCNNCELKTLFYKDIADKSMELICEKKFELTFHKGQPIISEGDEILYFSYLKSGLVKVFRTNEHKEQIIAITKPMDFVGILGIFSNPEYNYSVIALEDCITCNIDINLLRKIYLTNSEFTLSLLKKVSNIYDKIIIENIQIRHKHLRGRIAYILLMFANEIYFSNNFQLPLTRKEIAEYIGMTTENVIRTFSEFRKDKIITIDGKLIEIIDKPKMMAISDFG